MSICVHILRESLNQPFPKGMHTHAHEKSTQFFIRSVSMFAIKKEMVKPKESRFPKVEAPFLDDISQSGLKILLELNAYYTLIMKRKFEKNKAFLEVIYDSNTVIALTPAEQWQFRYQVIMI